MKRLTNMAVLLTIAAALATTVISCSSDDNLTGQTAELPAAEPQTVHVTVGAGISNDATRSAVVTDGNTRKLTFTAGDRLYVCGQIRGTAPQKIVAGYLDMVGTLASEATTATFSGDLSVYEKNSSTDKYESSSYTFTADDPLDECDDVDGTLVHENAVGFYVNEDTKYGDYTPMTASSVDELMTTNLLVYGAYDSSSKQFTLNNNSEDWCVPIFNCNISGLKPNTTYKVYHVDNFEAPFNVYFYQEVYTVTADADGKAVFTVYSMCETAEKFHVLKLISDEAESEEHDLYLGTKALASKVYNITREVPKFREAKFSVSTDKQVYFSKGNLYAYNGDSDWEWHFQSHQWECVGSESGNIYTAINNSGVKVDLFGWNGASSPNDNYGISSSRTDADYGTVAGEPLKNDWGHNVIDDYAADTWRTLTKSEWEYLLSERIVTNSLSDGARYTMATINGFSDKGLILFPDNYTHPSDPWSGYAVKGYTAGTYNDYSDYTTKVTLEFWKQMEDAGCVFLPAAGYRDNYTNGTPEWNSGGYYWSSTAHENTISHAYHLYFYKDYIYNSSGERSYGSSVRLVRDVE